MSSVYSAAANLAKLCIGVGVLALPYATSLGGLVFAPIVIGIVAAWNAVACDKMIECKYVCERLHFPEHLSSTYSRIAYAGAGVLGVMLTDFSIIITLFGVSIAYQITFVQLLQEIPWANFSTSTLTILFGLLAMPLCSVPNVGVLAVFSLIGLVCLIASVVAILVYGLIFYQSDTDMDDLSLGNPIGIAGGATRATLPLFPDSLSGVASFIGVATFCFGLCSLAFPVEESMRDKKQFGTAVLWSLAFVWFVYVLLGDLGSFLYMKDPAGIHDNILSNLPINSFSALLVRLAMTGVSLLTYPLTLVPPAQMIEHYIRSPPSFSHIKPQPQLHSTITSSNSNSTSGGKSNERDYGAIRMEVEMGLGNELATGSSEASEITPLQQPAATAGGLNDPNSSNDSSTSRQPRNTNTDSRSCDSESDTLGTRLIVRGIIVCATTVIATYIPCFGMVIALLGGFTVTILSFILPTYLHLQIVGFRRIVGAEYCSSSQKGLKEGDGYTEQQRLHIVYSDLALTIAGTLLCAVATFVTITSFMAKMSSGQQLT